MGNIMHYPTIRYKNETFYRNNFAYPADSENVDTFFIHDFGGVSRSVYYIYLKWVGIAVGALDSDFFITIRLIKDSVSLNSRDLPYYQKFAVTLRLKLHPLESQVEHRIRLEIVAKLFNEYLLYEKIRGTPLKNPRYEFRLWKKSRVYSLQEIVFYNIYTNHWREMKKILPKSFRRFYKKKYASLWL